MGSFGDSLDLVAIGGFYGNGIRKGFIGSYLLASYSEEDDHFYSVCKVGTGLSFENLKILTNLLKPLKDQPSNYVIH